MSKGKLIVLEGIDGSGKSTNYKLLCDRLTENGVDYHSIVFPRYDQESSALIRMYLNGEFGSRPDDVNAYTASTFFSVDRFAEITIEANPGTLKYTDLLAYQSYGINRLSIGLQSADDEMLRMLGRIHNFDQFVAGFTSARRAGFRNINAFS